MNSSLSLPNTGLRRHRSLSEAADLVAAWRASGVSKDAWSRAQGVSISTVYSCLKRVYRQSAPVEDHSGSGFIAVHPPRETVETCTKIRIELEGGAQICGLDLDGVIAVLRGLRETSS
jgi:hypothetical protein